MQLRGNVATALAQRLGSAIHMGVIGWERGFNRELRENIRASIFLTIIVAVVLGLLAYVVALNSLSRHLSFPEMLFISLSVATTAGLVQGGLTGFVALYAARKGMDPDNVTIPVVATLGDIFTVAILFGVVHLTLLLVSLAGG